jgi:hypothetical protein
MRKALLVVSILLVLAMITAGCANDAPVDASRQQAEDVSDNPDTYIDEQIIDEDETVEIGELI